MDYDSWKGMSPDDAADEFDRRQPKVRIPESWEEWDYMLDRIDQEDEIHGHGDT